MYSIITFLTFAEVGLGLFPLTSKLTTESHKNVSWRRWRADFVISAASHKNPLVRYVIGVG